MSEFDELYVMARRVLLDALDALGQHRDAIVLVGAQAVYLRVGDADLAVTPYTTDGDLVIDPAVLAEIPPLERALLDAGFSPKTKDSVGVWLTTRKTSQQVDANMAIDLLVPASVSPGTGRRAARLPGHDTRAARIVRGLDGAIVDADVMKLAALEEDDARLRERRGLRRALDGGRSVGQLGTRLIAPAPPWLDGRCLGIAKRLSCAIDGTMSETPTRSASTPKLDLVQPTLPDWLETWLRDHVRVRLRPLTQLAYARAARNFAGALDCSIPDEVTEAQLALVVAQWLREPRSVHRIRADVRSFTMALDWAVARGLVQRNVARALTLPPPPRTQPRWWTPEQVLTLLRATEGHALDGVFALAALLGVRRGEIMGLCWRHLDFEAGLIRIDQERVEVPHRRLHLQPPKTRASFRTLVMPARVHSALLHARALSDARAARLGRNRTPDDFLFLSRNSVAICPSYLHWELNRRIEQLALPRIRFHDLRHSAASWMLSLGLSPRTVADTLGHRNIETTLMIYAHVCLDQKRAAAEAIDAAMAEHERRRT